MSKTRNFLNKTKRISVKDLASKIANNHAIEKLLTPRLKAMGCILISFGVCSLFYAFFSANFESPYANFPEEMELTSGLSLDDDPATPAFELTASEKLNFYFVAFIFAAVGTGCIMLSIKKKREHFNKP